MAAKIMKFFLVSLVSSAMAVLLTACVGGAPEEQSQFTIGLVTNNSNGLRNVQGFRDAMAELGYIEGENVTYQFAGEPVSGAALDAAMEELVVNEVDLIFTAGTPTGVAAHRITAGTGIPVVFGVIADPVAAGVMSDLTQPGGNMTGVKLSASQDRRLELFLRIAPNIRRIFVPYNPEDTAPASAVDQILELAPDLGIELILGEARSDEEVVDLLVDLPGDIDGIFLVPDSTVNARLADIVAVANARKLPLSGPSTAQVEEGALTTYGFIHEAAGAQAARLADRVLRGADPGELPVETTEFFLAINLATADTLGLDIPDEILQEAEIIIRAETTE